MSLNTPSFGTLEGVKAVCATTALAGMYPGTMLAENGAEVIHIENPKSKDVLRFSGKGYLFAQEHRNIYELGLDIPSPEGRKVLERLIRRADVFIESSKGGTYQKWGLTDELFWVWNPKLVILHVSGYGQSGDPDYVRRASYDYTGQAFSGYANHSGKPEPNPPEYAKPVVCDYMTGTVGAMAVMMALYKAEKTGIGESIDLSQYEAMLRVQQHYAIEGFTDRTEVQRYEGLDRRNAGDAFYKCKDGKYVSVYFSGTNVIKRGLPILGLENDPDLQGVDHIWKDTNKEAADRFVNAMRDFTSKHTSDEVEKIMNDHQMPCAKLMTYEDMLVHPHYVARNDIIEFYSSHIDKNIKAPSAFPKFARNPQQIWRGGATHGEDNDKILRELGYSKEEIQALYACGVVAQMG
nr:CoA transferase [Fredinandcohnia onubensis]